MRRKARRSTTAYISLGGSQFLRVCHGRKEGPPPRVDLAHEIKVQSAARELICEGLVKSAHDCSEGGLAVALAECCFNPSGLLGADVDLENCGGSRAGCAGDTPASTEEALFNESQSRIVISVTAENLEKTMSTLRARDVPFQHLGKVGGDRHRKRELLGGDELRIRADNETFRWPILDLYDNWWNAICRAVESDSLAERIPSL